MSPITKDFTDICDRFWEDIKEDIYPEFEQELEVFLSSDFWQQYQHINTREIKL